MGKKTITIELVEGGCKDCIFNLGASVCRCLDEFDEIYECGTDWDSGADGEKNLCWKIQEESE